MDVTDIPREIRFVSDNIRSISEEPVQKDKKGSHNSEETDRVRVVGRCTR